MRIEWSIFTISDREEIFEFICKDSPRSAIALDDRIEAAVEELARFPKMGRLGRIKGTRELVIPKTPFVVAYRMNRVPLTILRVLHGARQWPNSL